MSDSWNHRVMKYRLGSSDGEVVAGGNGPGINNNQLNSPTGIAVVNGDLYVVDKYNHRIILY